MEFKEKESLTNKDVFEDFSVESSIVDVEALGEVTVKVKW